MAQWSPSNVYDVGMGISEMCLFLRANAPPIGDSSPNQKGSKSPSVLSAFPPKERQKQPKSINLKDCKSSRCCYLCWDEG